MLLPATDYALYTGCIIPLRYPDIENSIRETMPLLGVNVYDMVGAGCCPPGGAFWSVEEISGLAQSARNLSIAESMNKDLMAVCNGCFCYLKNSNLLLKNDKEKRERVNGILNKIGRKYQGTISVYHLVEILYDQIGTDKIKEATKIKLNGVKAAVHYGCHLLRPSDHLMAENPEKPHKLDALVEALGMESVYYPKKLSCCGAGGGMRGNNPDVTLKILEKKLLNIKYSDPDCIVTACPFCFLQFDLGQKGLRDRGEDFCIPVFYYNQLLGLSMGLPKNRIASISETPRDGFIKKFYGVD